MLELQLFSVWNALLGTVQLFGVFQRVLSECLPQFRISRSCSIRLETETSNPLVLYLNRFSILESVITMAKDEAKESDFAKGLLQSEELYKYILETSVFPREPEALKELRNITSNHPRHMMATAPDAGQLMAMLLNLVNAKKTIEVGVFTGYSLLLTALTLPEDGKVIAIDVNRDSYEIGLPIIKKAGVEHKIDFRESEALLVLEELLKDKSNEGGFDFAFVDADKENYWNYHERLMRLIKVGGVIVYDNTLWGGSVALPDSTTPEWRREGKKLALELNQKLSADQRVQISQAALGDGITICRRLY